MRRQRITFSGRLSLNHPIADCLIVWPYTRTGIYKAPGVPLWGKQPHHGRYIVSSIFILAVSAPPHPVQVGDAAVAALGAGACRHTLRWLDMTGTGVRDACVPSLRTIQQLEYVSLSSTGISMLAVAALARDLRLTTALPDAPKTRGRSNRTLLMGSKWSERQLECAPRREPTPPRQGSSPMYYERGTTRRGWVEGPSKSMRLVDAANIAALRHSASNFPVKVGFRRSNEGIDQGGIELLTNLVQGILKLWPAVPLR